MNQIAASQFSDGDAYERFMGQWSRKVGADFLAWCAIPPGATWLDVGCGNGAFTQEVLTRAAPRHVTGIDPSPAQIEFARKRLAGTPATFSVGEAQALPFPDQSFDVTNMALVIAFVADPAKGVAEMKRVTRAGGDVIAYMWDFPSQGAPAEPLFQALQKMGFPPSRPPQAHISTQPALEQLWRDQGLKDVASVPLQIEVRYPDFETFWETITLPTGPHVERMRSLSPDDFRVLRGHLEAAMPLGADGSISYAALANAVKGKV